MPILQQMRSHLESPPICTKIGLSVDFKIHSPAFSAAIRWLPEFRFGAICDMAASFRHVRLTPISDMGRGRQHVRNVPGMDMV
jgi:hypothetical protein